MKKLTLFKYTVALSIFEGMIAFFLTLSIGADPKNAFFAGISKSRLIVLLFQFSCLAGLFITLFFEQGINNKYLRKWFPPTSANTISTLMGFFTLFVLWVTIFTPTSYFMPYEAVVIRLKPTVIWLELLVLQFALYVRKSNSAGSASQKVSLAVFKNSFGFFVPLALIWILMTTSKVGLISDTAFWNVPGIPLSMVQFAFLLLFLLIGLVLNFEERLLNSPGMRQIFNIVVPLTIFIIAFLVWGLTPMHRHAFSLEATPPNLQPYPISDARVHDLGALSIVMGKGIYFKAYTDKPMYMLFLALLHTFMGNDYNLLQWAQVFVLACAPVILYYFGKKSFGTLFGILSALILILQRRNALVLSYKVASVNPKLLMTEELMLLGIIAVAYLLFQWMATAELKKVVQLGGALGALALVRINPIFIVPAVILIMVFKLRKTPRDLLKQVALFTLAFFLVFTPWLITGTNQQGIPWFVIKVQDVIQNRYPIGFNTINLQNSGFGSAPAAFAESSDFHKNFSSNQVQPERKTLTSELEDEKAMRIAGLMVSHFLHNISAAIMALPDSITILNLHDVTSREYWQDGNTWDGVLPAGQYVLILVNLYLLAVGIAHSWKRYHWAGLAPLFVFWAYNLSLSAALNSGSRYLVPINWIVFFYYGLGLFSFWQVVFRYLGLRKDVETPACSEMARASAETSNPSWLPTLAVVFALVCALPIANLVVPKFINYEKELFQITNAAVLSERSDGQMLKGFILYPYYRKDGTLSFDFLAGTKISGFTIEQQNIISPQLLILQSQTPALIRTIDVQGKKEIESIYLIVDKNLELIWQSK